jgi:hypothetical protein
MFMKDPPYTRTQQVLCSCASCDSCRNCYVEPDISSRVRHRYSRRPLLSQELVMVLRRMAAENRIDLDLPNIHLKN